MEQPAANRAKKHLCTFHVVGSRDVLSGVILTIAYLKYLFEFEHPSEVVLVKCFLVVVDLSL